MDDTLAVLATESNGDGMLTRMMTLKFNGGCSGIMEQTAVDSGWIATTRQPRRLSRRVTPQDGECPMSSALRGCLKQTPEPVIVVLLCRECPGANWNILLEPAIIDIVL